MDKKSIIDAYCRIRTIDQTIPYDVLDFMKDAALAALEHSPKPDVSETKHNCIYRPGDENYEC
jgi:hypothetical protein